MSCCRYGPKETEAVAMALLWADARGVSLDAFRIRRVEFILDRELGDIGFESLFGHLARHLDYLNAQAYADRYSEPLSLAYAGGFMPKPPSPYGIGQTRRALQDWSLAGGWAYQASDVRDAKDIAAVERVVEALNATAWAIIQAEHEEAEARAWEARNR